MRGTRQWDIQCTLFIVNTSVGDIHDGVRMDAPICSGKFPALKSGGFPDYCMPLPPNCSKILEIHCPP